MVHLATQPGVEVDHDRALKGAGARARLGPELRDLPGLHRAARGAAPTSDRFPRARKCPTSGSRCLHRFAALGMLRLTTNCGFVDPSILPARPRRHHRAGVHAHHGVAGGVIAGIVAGMILGSVNGVLIGIFRTNPVLTTLGTNVAAIGHPDLHQGDIVYSESGTSRSSPRTGHWASPTRCGSLPASPSSRTSSFRTRCSAAGSDPDGGNYAAARAAVPRSAA